MSPYQWGNPDYSSFGFKYSSGKTVKIIILVNIILFFLINLLPQFPWIRLFGLVPSLIFTKLWLWQFFSYMFLHAGLWHLVINMLMLWFFGPAIESSWGQRQFLFYFFFTGVGAGLCSFFTGLRSSLPVIGASGAIFGILVAYAMMFPETVILLFFIFPMRIKQAVLILAGINLLGALSSPNAGIAYFAHLGGGLFGFLYLKNERLRREAVYWFGANLKSVLHRKRDSGREKVEENFEQKVDSILDKISQHGLESLSNKERKILELKRKRKRN